MVRKRYSNTEFLDNIVVSIPACHAGDRNSIPYVDKKNDLFYFRILFKTAFGERRSTKTSKHVVPIVTVV